MLCPCRQSKRVIIRFVIIFFIAAGFLFENDASALSLRPPIFLSEKENAIQLMVEGEPFLMLAGELGNSSASSLEYMDPLWDKLEGMNLNTLLVPVYWELIEPTEGQFDFKVLDGIIKKARKHNLRLVLLWFGTWKNSMSCYTPEWVKEDYDRFPRARLKDGTPMEILSAFNRNNLESDKRAFIKLMQHLKKVDSRKKTVLMIQVENEIGMLKDARDYCQAANDAFSQPVPKELMNYLTRHRDALQPEIVNLWKNSDFTTDENWEQVFGKSLQTDELFMAWHYAKYVEEISRAGKNEYPLPMYVNAALIRPDYQPGQYPSAGPLPHLIDAWRAGAPSIDFMSPDIYFPNFTEWCQRYDITGNAFFIPEAARSEDMTAHAFYAIGAHNAMGFSPFSIESEAANTPITQCYDILSQLSPLILKYQGTENLAGCLLDRETPTQNIQIAGYTLKCSHDYTWAWSGGNPDAETWPRAGGIVISTGPDEFIIAGKGIIVTFPSADSSTEQVGIGRIEEGSYKNGKWHPVHVLNGDQSHQGRHLHIQSGQCGIQYLKLYRYQ